MSTVEVEARVLPAPPGEYFDAAWIERDRLVVDVDLEEQASRLEPLREMGSDGTGLRLLDLPRRYDECFRVIENRPARLTDGRLGYMETCEFEDITATSRQRLLAWDFRGAPVTLIEAPAGITSYTWDPEVRHGLWSRDSSICAGIGTMTRGEGLSGLPISLPDADWTLDASLENPDGDCTDEGRAGGPAWSPNGKTIAFAASPQSAGVQDQGRLDEPWNLYLMDAADRRPRAVLRDIRSLGGPLWSPNSRWLAFVGDVPGAGTGVYLFHVADGRTVKVFPNAGPTSWSPDGTELLVIRRVTELGATPRRTELLRLDVSEVVGR